MIVSHAINNMLVTPLTILEVDGITIRVMLGKLSGNMEIVKQKFLQSHFLQRDHQGFLKDVEVRLIDKSQASDPNKREFY